MPPAATAGQVREALLAATDALTAAGVDTPRLDADVLLAEAMDRDRTGLAAEPEAPVDAAAARRFGEMIRRRIRREPVAYILGRKGFRGIELRVDRRVLIPRPESELLVEVALELEPESVLDVGTGSGAIALAVAAELPECAVVATDTSGDALEVAGENAERLGLAARVSFERGTVPATRRFDLVLANLPYVREGELASLEPEITEYEPRQAVVAGADGLESIAVVAAASCAALTDRGALALEVGAGQAGEVAELLVDLGFAQVEGRQDLAGVPRVVLGRMGG
ncbi:MAG TPA: peptide chain release factor N(5)-glutamine methyltransferase [Solirubrobacterales bacterium]|jgi:release factor glutamine methyltransferase|nr:peptide chain release factor N(5)-glutamine methyltransferase [Solirubrobacterales bacterium]